MPSLIKGKKYWLIYAYERQSSEIVAYVWDKRDLKTAKRLREKLIKPGVSFGCVLNSILSASLSFLEM
jgi:IS1 family transposase